MSEPGAGREPDPPPGRVRPTRPGTLVVAGLVGFVLGWSVRPLSMRFDFAEPVVTLTAIGMLFFVAAMIAAAAYATRRTVQRDRFALAHHQAVNRLALGKACAFAGALLVGGYLGYAVAQLGVGTPASEARLWRSCVAAAGAFALTLAALRLEHACRVPPTDD